MVVEVTVLDKALQTKYSLPYLIKTFKIEPSIFVFPNITCILIPKAIKRGHMTSVPRAGKVRKHTELLGSSQSWIARTQS